MKEGFAHGRIRFQSSEHAPWQSVDTSEQGEELQTTLDERSAGVQGYQIRYSSGYQMLKDQHAHLVVALFVDIGRANLSFHTLPFATDLS